MIRLRARVRCNEGKAGQYPSTPTNEPTSSEKPAQIPIPQWVEIEQAHEGFLLIHIYLREGPFIHTWHSSIESAKAEAKEDFSINEDEWVKEVVEEP